MMFCRNTSLLSVLLMGLLACQVDGESTGAELSPDQFFLGPALGSADISGGVTIYVPSGANLAPASCFLDDASQVFSYGNPEDNVRIAVCLQEKLELMYPGMGFPIADFSGNASGIFLGRDKDYSNIDHGFSSGYPRNEYAVETFASLQHEGVLLIGEDYVGVELAAWRFLKELGYAQLAPTAAWEVLPVPPPGAIDIAIQTAPAFASRSVRGSTRLAGYGNLHRAWLHKNLIHLKGMDSGHSWNTMLATNGIFPSAGVSFKDWFVANSGAASSVPPNTKFCTGYNATLSIEDAVVE